MLSVNIFVYTVLFLGVTLLACVAGIIYLAANGHTIPDILQNTSSAVVAGMLGLLVTPKRDA